MSTTAAGPLTGSNRSSDSVPPRPPTGAVNAAVGVPATRPRPQTGSPEAERPVQPGSVGRASHSPSRASCRVEVVRRAPSSVIDGIWSLPSEPVGSGAVQRRSSSTRVSAGALRATVTRSPERRTSPTPVPVTARSEPIPAARKETASSAPDSTTQRRRARPVRVDSPTVRPRAASPRASVRSAERGASGRASICRGPWAAQEPSSSAAAGSPCTCAARPSGRSTVSPARTAWTYDSSCSGMCSMDWWSVARRRNVVGPSM